MHTRLPQGPEITALPVSSTFCNKPGTQTDTNGSPPIFMPDVSTLNMATRRSLSSASVTGPIHMGTTRSQDTTSGSCDSSSISLLPSPPRIMTDGLTLPQMASSTEVSVTGALVLTSREPEQSSVPPPTLILTTSRQRSTVSVTLPTETIFPGETLTLSSSTQGQSLRAPASGMTHSSISISEVQTSLTTQLTADLASSSSFLPGSMDESFHFPGWLKTTDLVGMSMASGFTTSPVWTSSSHDTLPTPKTIRDIETKPLTDTTVTTYGAISSCCEPCSSALTHSGSHKTISSVSTVEATNPSQSFSIYSMSTRTKEEPVLTQTSGLRETSSSQDTSSATDGNMVLSQVYSAALPEVTRTEFSSPDGVSNPGSAQSSGTPNISKGMSTHSSTPSLMTEASHIISTTSTGPSRVIPRDALTLDQTTRDFWEWVPLDLTQSFLLSEMTPAVSRGPETLPQRSPSPKETRFPSSPVSFPSLSSPSPSSSEARGPRVLTSLPPTSGLTSSTSSANFQSQETTAFPGTGSPADSFWPPSPATLEVRSPEMTTVDTPSGASNKAPKAPTSDIAETTLPKEISPPVVFHPLPSLTTPRPL